MTMFARVVAGLALGTALAGGIVALGATAAGAETGPIAGAGIGDGANANNNHLLNNQNNNNYNTHWFNPNQNWWNQTGRADNRNSREALGMAVKDIALGFQEKDNREDKQFLNNWWNNNATFGGNNWWNNNLNHNQQPLQTPARQVVTRPVVVQPVQRVVRPVTRERVAQPIVLPIERQRVIQPTRRFDGLRGLDGI